MPIKPVIRIGHPLLNLVAEPVNEITQELKQGVIQDMLDTMAAEDGAGIAAPQIGVSQRIVIFGIEKNPRYPEAEPVPTTILINPKITPLTKETKEGWEGCLSVPGFRGKVARYTKIQYTGLDENGVRIDRTVTGFHAIVVQHEVDHLDGILYTQKITDMAEFGLLEELEASGRIPKIDKTEKTNIS